jgi:hypothetical protein
MTDEVIVSERRVNVLSLGWDGGNGGKGCSSCCLSWDPPLSVIAGQAMTMEMGRGRLLM